MAIPSTNRNPTSDRWLSRGRPRRLGRRDVAPLLLIAGLLAGVTSITAAASELARATCPLNPVQAMPADPAAVRGPAPEPASPAPVTQPAPAPEPATPAQVVEPAPAPSAPAPAVTGDLVQVQERLRELGYLVGPADGQSGQQTTTTIMAFQRVHGLSVDGVVGPQTLAALDGPVVVPELRGGPATRIEVDLDRQVLHLVEDAVRIGTLKVSSGNGDTYRTASGDCVRVPVRTPPG